LSVEAVTPVYLDAEAAVAVKFAGAVAGCVGGAGVLALAVLE